MSAVMTEEPLTPASASSLPVMCVCFGTLDERAAQKIVQHPDGGPVYEVVALADVTLRESWPGRKVLLWWNGSASGAADMLALGTRLTEDPAREVKFLSPRVKGEEFGPWQAVEELAWTWPDFFAWAKPAAKLFTREAFELAMVSYGMSLDEPEAEPLIPPEPDDDAADAFIASLTDGSYGEPPPDISEDSQAFHGEPFARSLDGQPDPLDLWDGAKLPEVDPAWLPREIADYAMDQAALIGCDPVQLAVNCVTISAACITEGIGVQMMADNTRWNERARVWGCVVGDPSTKKGPALDAATGHFQKLAHELRARQEAELTEYQIQAKVHEKRMAAYVSAVAKNEPCERPPAPDRPLSQRLWTDDPTKEAVALLLSSHARGKLAILKDELSGWFGSFDAYSSGKGEKDKPDWLSSYEGKERYIDRARDGGQAIHVPRWSVCILGGIQPSVINRIAAKLGEDGMMQRFQVVTAQPATEGEERRPDLAATARWQRVQSNLLALGPSENPVRFSPEAQALRSEVSRWINKAMRSGVSSGLIAALGKWEGLFGRLCITSHCIESAERDRLTPDPVISLATAQQVWAYMQQLLWPHANAFYEGGTAEPEQRQWVKWIAGLILVRRWESLNTANLFREWSRYRNLKPYERAELLNSLVTAGWLAPNGGMDQTGKMPTRYLVNPLVHDGRFDEHRHRYEAQRARMAETAPMFRREAGAD